jgi:GNAT superfamily N-acetyltransferase
VIAPELAAFAEDPAAFVEPSEGTERIENERFCLTISPGRVWGGICRLRLRPDEVEETVSEIRRLTDGVATVTWNVGSSVSPPNLPDRLRRLGLGDPEPPLDPVCAALVLATEPPGVDGIDVRRVETFEDFLTGLEIVLAADTWSAESAARERERARENFERRQRRGAFQWLAFLDGQPVGFAEGARGSVGLYLDGGATLPEARGHGCYRALVRERWDEAMRLGLPGLAVQAKYTTSAPILRRLGFEDVATIHPLQ